VSNVVSLLLPAALLAAVLGLVIRGGRLSSFRPSMANVRFRTARGPMMATWLALVAATWGLIDLVGKGWLPVPASVVATLMIAVVVGLVVAQRTTLFLLALVGLLTQFGGLAEDYGPAVAVAVVVLTGVVTWLFGAVRGFIAPR
jgi:hypothetical protein